MQVCFWGCQMGPFASGSSLSALCPKANGAVSPNPEFRLIVLVGFGGFRGVPLHLDFSPRSGIILSCVGRSPASGISDASLLLGLSDVAFCIRQQFVGVVPKGEWGRFSEPGILPDCAGWLQRLLGRPLRLEF